MSPRITTPNVETASAASAALFARIKKAAGRVPNAYAVIGTLEPAALDVILKVDAVLAGSSLTKEDQEAIKLTVSEAVGCDYCTAAHTVLAELAGHSPEAARQIRTGAPTGDAKRDALVAFVRHLVTSRGTLGEEQFVAIKAAGYTDAQLVDIALAMAVITFTNVFNRINDTELDFPVAA